MKETIHVTRMTQLYSFYCWLLVSASMNHHRANIYKKLKNAAKVKCTLVQALRFRTGRTDHRGSRGIALPFHDHGTRRG